MNIDITDDERHFLRCMVASATQTDRAGHDINFIVLTNKLKPKDQFYVHDYVQYIGPVTHWRGLYIVHRIEDDDLVLRAKSGGEARPPASDVKLLYRPTSEELQ
jgi:hypothetical protein